MILLIVKNKTKQTTLGENIRAANTFLTRLKGLMFKKHINPGEGLYIYPCKGIHTFFMGFPIDVIFINNRKQVVYLINKMKPWALSPVIREAHGVLELPENSIINKNIEIGDSLEFLEF